MERSITVGVEERDGAPEDDGDEAAVAKLEVEVVEEARFRAGLEWLGGGWMVEAAVEVRTSSMVWNW